MCVRNFIKFWTVRSSIVMSVWLALFCVAASRLRLRFRENQLLEDEMTLGERLGWGQTEEIAVEEC